MRPRHRNAPPGVRPWLLLALALGGAGCPQDLEVVAARGQPCERDDDCQQADLPCGEVLACLGGHCQAAGETPGIIEVCAEADPMSRGDGGGSDGADGGDVDSGMEPGGN